MGALSRIIAHIYTLFLVFFTVLFLEIVILIRSVTSTIGYLTVTDDTPITTEQYLKLINQKNPTTRYKQTGLEPKECSVCLSGLEEGDEIRKLRCKHVFHRGCVDTWLENDRATCPICRRLVLPEAIVVKYRQRREMIQPRRRREFYGGSDEELILLLTSLHGNYMRRFM
uniref:E3 ubiquitin-protein ligase RHA2B-like n=1 Tax=Erigeron canadensis TaxID=72917 RepID=UPI001CB930B4|nr:E3 ubiquitin-protein ligase RHA2B-like [Erigeron canadensis]